MNGIGRLLVTALLFFAGVCNAEPSVTLVDANVKFDDLLLHPERHVGKTITVRTLVCDKRAHTLRSHCGEPDLKHSIPLSGLDAGISQAERHCERAVCDLTGVFSARHEDGTRDRKKAAALPAYELRVVKASFLLPVKLKRRDEYQMVDGVDVSLISEALSHVKELKVEEYISLIDAARSLQKLTRAELLDSKSQLHQVYFGDRMSIRSYLLTDAPKIHVFCHKRMEGNQCLACANFNEPVVFPKSRNDFPDRLELSRGSNEICTNAGIVRNKVTRFSPF